MRWPARLNVEAEQALEGAAPKGFKPKHVFIVKGKFAGLQGFAWAISDEGEKLVILNVEDETGMWEMPADWVGV